MTLILFVFHTPIGDKERNDKVPFTLNGDTPRVTPLINDSLSRVTGVNPSFTLAGNDTGKELLGDIMPGVIPLLGATTTGVRILSSFAVKLPCVASPTIDSLPGVTSSFV